MTPQEWITAYAARLGVEPPDQTAVEQLLDLAGVAAHASERWAAPLSCWLAAASGTPPADALAAARALAESGPEGPGPGAG